MVRGMQHATHNRIARISLQRHFTDNLQTIEQLDWHCSRCIASLQVCYRTTVRVLTKYQATTVAAVAVVKID